MSIFTQPKIDGHCHVIDPTRFPFRADTSYQPSGQEVAPFDHFSRMMDLYGVRHAVIVGTNSGYGDDNNPVLDALSRSEGRMKGVAVVANDIAASDLARLKAGGIIGIAFNSPYHGTAYYADTSDLLRKLTDLDMFLQIQVKDDQLLDLLPTIESSNVRLVFDHCGRPAPQHGLDQPGFRALTELGRTGRASVKLSGYSQFSRERHPYADTRPYVDALIESFTLDRCVWGSDWPFLRATERIDYGPLLSLIETWLPDESDRRKVLWDTPRRLFGFGG